MPQPAVDDLGALASLHDPVRMALYRHIAACPDGLDRAQAARMAGVSRPLAAYHLDRLVDAGLLEAAYRRPAGRRGPGAGRPAKIYSRSARSVQVSVPPRNDALAAELLAAAVEAERDRSLRDRLIAIARGHGSSLGAAARASCGPRASRRRLGAALLGGLRDTGFEPEDAGQVITLRNCPFDRLARSHRSVACGMNLALVEGLVEGIGIAGLGARLDPGPGRCCVVVDTVAR